MVSTHMSGLMRPQRPPTHRERIRKALPALASAISAFALLSLPRIQKSPEPVHDSAFTGQMWVDELQSGIYTVTLHLNRS